MINLWKQIKRYHKNDGRKTYTVLTSKYMIQMVGCSLARVLQVFKEMIKSKKFYIIYNNALPLLQVSFCSPTLKIILANCKI